MLNRRHLPPGHTGIDCKFWMNSEEGCTKKYCADVHRPEMKGDGLKKVDGSKQPPVKPPSNSSNDDKSKMLEKLREAQREYHRACLSTIDDNDRQNSDDENFIGTIPKDT